MECGILVPQPGIKSASPAIPRQTLNHWTTRAVPAHLFLYSIIYLYQHEFIDIYFILCFIIQHCFIFLLRLFQVWASWELFQLTHVFLWYSKQCSPTPWLLFRLCILMGKDKDSWHYDWATGIETLAPSAMWPLHVLLSLRSQFFICKMVILMLPLMPWELLWCPWKHLAHRKFSIN